MIWDTLNRESTESVNSVKTTSNVQKAYQNQNNLSSKTSSSNNKSSNLNSNNACPSQPLNILEFKSIPELTDISLTTQNE
ncbi:unnamed protein product [Brachionus calyciflorus]|uniref:Uncharacterized protein n=1 Tax=Brachionus calyciflorus TaxID=104777 RepID=A0A814NVH7_9BILA|nr:unnamed protein product [Brachionus calyciflorus]